MKPYWAGTSRERRACPVPDEGTTNAVRAAIQRSQASLATLSRELLINPKPVARWRKRAMIEDLKTGPKAPHSTTLSEAEEAMVVAFRRHTLLPLARPREGRGLPLRVAAIDPAVDAVSVASLPPAARHIPSADIRVISRSASASRVIPSASFTAILPRCRPPKARRS
jgi:hypothetical protein